MLGVGGGCVGLNLYSGDVFHHSLGERAHCLLLLCVGNEVLRYGEAVVGLLGAEYKRAAGDADAVAVGLHALVGNRQTHRHG